MLKFLANEDTWRQLKAISQNRKDTLYVAVPFLGSGGGKLIHLKRGDVLVGLKFRRGCSAYGLKLRPNIGVRQITSPTHAAKVLALVSRKLS